jgi:hypothetical protein
MTSPVPDVALRLRCSACGLRNVKTHPDWKGRRMGEGIGGRPKLSLLVLNYTSKLAPRS